MSRPTQRQIAERLGLSPATVSLAMRDSPLVARSTKALVRRAMEEAGYVPNAAASALRTGRSRIVGVSFHNIAHQFFAEILIAIEETLAASGAAVFINNHGEDPTSRTRFLESLASYGADGLMVSPPPDVGTDIFDPVRRLGMPVVYLARHLPNDPTADWVINADHAAIQLAVERLLSLGHRRIVLVGGQTGTSVCDTLVEGFCMALRAAGVPCGEAAWVPCRPRFLEGAAAAESILLRPEPPTGYVCYNDLVAFGTMNAMRAHGVEPGRDAAIVGMGGTPEAAAFFPGLTTVLENPAKIGQLAAEILLARLENPGIACQRVALQPRLIVRTSCGGPLATG